MAIFMNFFGAPAVNTSFFHEILGLQSTGRRSDPKNRHFRGKTGKKRAKKWVYKSPLVRFWDPQKRGFFGQSRDPREDLKPNFNGGLP